MYCTVSALCAVTNVQANVVTAYKILMWSHISSLVSAVTLILQDQGNFIDVAGYILGEGEVCT